MRRVFSQHTLVDSDIEEIGDYIAKDNHSAARAVVRAIYHALDAIRNDPEKFPFYEPKTFENNFLHRAVCLPYRNYLIFYELFPKEVRILYVHHGARQFEARHHKEKRM